MQKTEEIPSNGKIYILSFIHVLRIAALLFIFISPIVFVILAVISAFSSEWVNVCKWSIMALLFHFSYSVVMDWFEEERIKFKTIVNRWSEYHENIERMKK
jgi:hypothetical protein